VVVAFVLLSLVLATSFEIFSAGFQRAGELEDRSRALVLAQSKLAAAGVEEAIKEGDTHGESDDRRFQWAVSIRRLDDGTPPPSIYAMYTIDVRVAWRSGDTRERALSLASMTLGPRP
jgi:general secretion pathway protein I